MGAEADADAYTIGQVAHGLPVHNAYATGHPYNVGAVTYTSYPSTYPSHAVVAPAVHSVAAVPAVATPGVYSTYNRHYVGKREAEADAYTIGQVAHGLPIHNAYATGHPYNTGYVGYTSYPTSHLGYAGVH